MVATGAAGESAPCPHCDASSHQLWNWDLVRTLCTCPMLPVESPTSGRHRPMDKGACAQVLVPAECSCPKRHVEGLGMIGCDAVREKRVEPRCAREQRRVVHIASGDVALEDSR
jgi:hypothetical protein